MKKHLPVFILIVLGIATRFLPHPANFTSIGGLAIFSGIYLPKKWALTLPLLAMFFSDLFIGFYGWSIMLPVYISFVVMVAIGFLVAKKKNIATIIGGTILGSLIFFIITNGAVWAFTNWYEHSLNGFINCYAMAIPFFRNSLLGDLFYAGTLIGAYEVFLAFLYRKNKVEAVAK